eukprot:m.225912 g.225912  ORF g.225912 m.225912 type:complete len:108 (+) comp13861_c0_seq13:583-906(+)
MNTFVVPLTQKCYLNNDTKELKKHPWLYTKVKSAAERFENNSISLGGFHGWAALAMGLSSDLAETDVKSYWANYTTAPRCYFQEFPIDFVCRGLSCIVLQFASVVCA